MAWYKTIANTLNVSVNNGNYKNCFYINDCETLTHMLQQIYFNTFKVYLNKNKKNYMFVNLSNQKLVCDVYCYKTNNLLYTLTFTNVTEFVNYCKTTYNLKNK